MEKTTIYPKALFLYSLFLLLGFSTFAQNSGHLVSEIKEANKKFVQAFNDHDADALSMAYTKDAKAFPSNSEVVSGREAIKEFWNNVLEMDIAKVELNTIDAERCGNNAIEEGTYTLYDSNNTEMDHGKYIVVWKKENGEWKLSRDIWNTSMPAPEQ